MFILIYLTKDDVVKRVTGRIFDLPKGTVKNDNVILIGKRFYGQTIDFDMKWYSKTKKVKRRQGEVFYVNNRYKLLVVNLIDADPKEMQQIELANRNNCWGGAIVDCETMLVLMILRKIKETRL